ncbi:hypothetical protein MC7420_6724 [Coleofasciculus chthonoplastes PCC 7420]|uniref:Uncharacterized protein n=1 Tax=Coleofasciculus chthonoplastes PCC 7420 TaxID=118168 RepID=B4VW82_9CYAN|nr:hypothetical protein MC7420_6724 [Coleofasciculus chthonoplastes PCC 7420]
MESLKMALKKLEETVDPKANSDQPGAKPKLSLMFSIPYVGTSL